MLKNKFNIMYDADKGSTGGVDESKVDESKVDKTDAVDGAKDKDADKEKPLTIAEVQKMIQSETDRVRGEYSQKLKEKTSELEELRLSTLSEEDRQKEQQKTLQDELSRREADLKVKELTLTTIDLLKENELPIEAKSFLIGKDEESTKSNIDEFKKMFGQAVESAVTNRFKETGKEHINSSGKGGRYTQADIAKMTPAEINSNWEKIQRDLS